ALNKGAGSEASLPVTLRSRRSAPKLLFPPRFREEPKSKASKMRWTRKKIAFQRIFIARKRRSRLCSFP
ncbi:MAG: hypothetical protein UDR59_06965, partial [Christensenellales bacterium]|nr:hypothetical protein [Christensenellales bacterium]